MHRRGITGRQRFQIDLSHAVILRADKEIRKLHAAGETFSMRPDAMVDTEDIEAAEIGLAVRLAGSPGRRPSARSSPRDSSPPRVAAKHVPPPSPLREPAGKKAKPVPGTRFNPGLRHGRTEHTCHGDDWQDTHAVCGLQTVAGTGRQCSHHPQFFQGLLGMQDAGQQQGDLRVFRLLGFSAVEVAAPRSWVQPAKELCSASNSAGGARSLPRW